MLERERQKVILHYLKQHGFISIKELVPILGASEATIRRDLTVLADQGLISRIRGGAELSEAGEGTPSSLVPPRLPEASFENRKDSLRETKRAIAQKAVSLIRPEDTIIIDGGSTTYYMAEFMTALRIQVITNSFAISEFLLKNSSNTIICTGGIIYPEHQIILNPFETDVFRYYYASKVFMSVKGIDENGVTNSDPLLIQTEREMIERGKELILLADSSKFQGTGPLYLCGFDKVRTIITDSGIPDAMRDLLQEKAINLVIA
jgi:DeoR family transcriptional regulator, ulaG and ulaABCDEF operon transcriptional repressor